MSLTLVVLTAGQGTRFGGNKPLAVVGPDGQCLFEYSVYDACKAGFNHIIIVVSDQQDTTAFSGSLDIYSDVIKIEFIRQSLFNFANTKKADPVVSRRQKPWGTAHAVLVCRDHIDNPFVVLNADDYYGRENFIRIGQYLLEHSHDPQACALPGYKLKNTLSRSGGVNRGICSVTPDGYLASIVETRNILPENAALPISGQLNETVNIDYESLVSMTFWGFQPSLFALLEAQFQVFLDESTDLDNDEFYIPVVVDRAIKSAQLRPRVLPTSEIWKGLTYAADLTEVRAYIFSLTKRGVYPEQLGP